MNVFYGVVGEPLKLEKKTMKRYNGTLEGYLYLWILARNKSIENIYIVSGDWNKLNSNELKELDPCKKITAFKNDSFIYENLKDKKIDVGIIKAGYAWGRINTQNKIWKNEKEHYSPLSMQVGYSSRMLKYLNKSKIPYVLLINDPRLIHKNKLVRLDTMNHPLELMCQLDYNLEFKSLEKFEDSFEKQKYKTSIIPVRYRALDKIISINYKDEVIFNKNIKMTFATMQDVGKGMKKSRRFNMLKEWIFDKDKDNETRLYGRWDDYFVKGLPQFKGFLQNHEELDNILRCTKYTFVVGIDEDWTTSKWGESLSLGIIPFISPDYDTQYNSIPKDIWIRVNTPEELWEKIGYLENNDDKRIKLLKELKETLFKDVDKGIFFYKELNKALKPLNISLSIEQESEVKRKTNNLF